MAQAQNAPVMRKLSENKFAPLPPLPPCTTVSVESGDPAKGASVIIFKATAGCVIPWHWHTPNEHVMMVSGSAKLEMKDGGHSTVLGAGGYALLPSKHVHQFTCTAACTAFVYSDAAFDMHYVDAKGTEITPDAAIGKKK
jgi:quercetin dioxygenase-like cupin family protein